VLRNFMRTVPGEIMEAARIDGASEWGIYWQRYFIGGLTLGSGK
jgi:ABC-type glycerol-3-phosphate transport system permease component